MQIVRILLRYRSLYYCQVGSQQREITRMKLRNRFSHAFIAAICLAAITGSVFAQTDDAQKRLTENRRKWAEKAIKNYQYEFQRICFCPPAYTKLVKLTVGNGVVENVQYAETGEAVDKSRYEHYMTVEALFDYIQAAIDRKAHAIKVQYDAELGYPTSVEIDYLQYAVDDEMRFKTGKLVVEKQ